LQIEREMARQVLLTPEEMAQLMAQAPARPYGAAPVGAAPAGAAPAVQPVSTPAGRGADAGTEGGPDFHDVPPPDFDYEPVGLDYDGEPAGSGRSPPAGRPGARRGQGDWQGRQSGWKGGKQGKGEWRGRRDDEVGGYQGRRSMPSLAKRLLALLLAHPELVDGMGDQQLEVLDKGPHLGLVRDLVLLAQASGARHVGALLQAADPDSDLAA